MLFVASFTASLCYCVLTTIPLSVSIRCHTSFPPSPHIRYKMAKAGKKAAAAQKAVQQGTAGKAKKAIRTSVTFHKPKTEIRQREPK